MMKNFLKITLLSALVLAFSACTSTVKPEAQTHLQAIVKSGELVLGTSGNMVPMTHSIDSGKDAIGFDIDLARTMAQTMGAKLVIKVMPFEELLPALERGDVDVVISNMTITPKRNTQVAFVGPYMTSGKCLVTKISDLATANKDELNKASNKLAVLKGSTSEEYVKLAMPNVVAVSVATQEEAIQMVRDTRVSALLTDYPVCKATILNNPDDHFVSVFSNLTYEPIGIAVNPNNTHLLNWTQNFLDRADNVGLFKVLAAKWLGNN